MVDSATSRTVVIINPEGLHARPADLFVQTAKRYDAKIEIIKDNERVDGKSILSIMTLAAVEGTELKLEANGHDAEAALEELVALVSRGFKES